MNSLKTSFSTDFVNSLIRDLYGLVAEASTLPGELDLNFLINTGNRKFIFKIANPAEIRENLELQHAVIKQISKQAKIQTSNVVPALNGQEIVSLNDLNGKIRFVRLLTWVDGKVLATAHPHSDLLLENLGMTLGRLTMSLKDFDHPAAHRFIKWDPRQARWIQKHLHRFSGERLELANYFFDLFLHEISPIESSLRLGVNYNDANDYNVLVDLDPKNPIVPGVIDFGDVTFTFVVNELAIALAYVLMKKPDPMHAARSIISGYHAIYPLTEVEMAALFPLVCTRLLISVTCAELNRAEHPDNEYLQISDVSAWALLKKLRQISPNFAHAVVREACGLEPSPLRKKFDSWIRQKAKNTFPINHLKANNNIQWLDLSVGSIDIGNMGELNNPESLSGSVVRKMKELDVSFIMGRYDEVRAIYTTDAYRVEENDGPAWRTNHIGLDIFCSPGTPVFIWLDGVIHSYQDNNQNRDYGPTIIIQHELPSGEKFYSLYGHLSRYSLEGISVGMRVSEGRVIGAVGDQAENGNWPPHLHFQIILDILNQKGDFPGVCTPLWSNVYRSICPDPWQVLTGSETPKIQARSKSEIISYRKMHLGKNMSMTYRDPLLMQRGDGCYLIDHTGRRYLDTVNNVAHVGHEHPRVVRAGQLQMAVLNTNTRYLHENLVKFTESLLATMPEELNVAFLVNSGSEANELALRLARTATGQKDLIVSQVGYHGNTNACVEISSYKFDGPGGNGPEPHVHVIPIPDGYRGLYRFPDPEVGTKYAAHVGGAISRIRQEGRGIAALIFESVISCGGQVELPQKFLSESYRMVRNAGGVCIADEVQTGCGRSGSHFWAFEKHGVVPDIVTIGKPIGNGHPLGVVVTTQRIADSFKNGMEYFNTFGGNPVSCAIGLEVLNVIRDESLQKNAFVTGSYLKDGLISLMKDLPIIGDVRGSGLFLGFELVEDPQTRKPASEKASWFANRMKDKGILMGTDGPFNNVLKIKPPLVFDKNDADFLLESVLMVLKEDRFHI